ncbi:DUF397 domain-containing protein [Nocardia sp. NPDC052278]|uniref:DUF397 domain-containing protein n=1 Tax=unclassified Nocardia TaxID=2637762 RepID=UPI00369228B1
MSMDLVGAQWFKSTRSGAGKDCVEVAFLAGGRIGVRDSKIPVDLPSSSVWAHGTLSPQVLRAASSEELRA